MRVLGDERLGGRVNSFARGVYMDFTISVVLVEGKKNGHQSIYFNSRMSAAPSCRVCTFFEYDLYILLYLRRVLLSSDIGILYM